VHAVSNEAHEIVEELYQAFASSRGSPKSEKELVTGLGWEDSDIERDFKPAISGDVDDGILEKYKDSLASFSARGLLVVLPYYLSYSLRHPASEVADFTIYRLASAEPTSTYWSERLDLISPRMRVAICRSLSYLQPFSRGYTQEQLSRAKEFWCEQSGK
jgi:hypothetical protein